MISKLYYHLILERRQGNLCEGEMSERFLLASIWLLVPSAHCEWWCILCMFRTIQRSLCGADKGWILTLYLEKTNDRNEVKMRMFYESSEKQGLIWIGLLSSIELWWLDLFDIGRVECKILETPPKTRWHHHQQKPKKKKKKCLSHPSPLFCFPYWLPFFTKLRLIHSTWLQPWEED